MNAFGKVTVHGTPLTSGTVMFVPVSGGKHAMGTLGADGEFTLSTYAPQDGAVEGQHKVVIQVSAIGADGASIPGADRVSTKYAAAETTPLTVEVKKSADPILIDIQD